MKRGSFIAVSAIVIIAIVVILAYFFYFTSDGANAKIRTVGFHKRSDFKMDVAPEDKKKISDIITTMGTTSTFGLAFEQGRLEKLGDEINHVPPLEFQAVIFSDPQLAYYMRVIRESSMKYNNYVKGLQPGLVKEYQDGHLLEKTKGFAEYLNIPVDQTVAIVKKCSEDALKTGNKLAYKPFVDYLIEQKSPKTNPQKGNGQEMQNGSQENKQMMNGQKQESSQKEDQTMNNGQKQRDKQKQKSKADSCL